MSKTASTLSSSRALISSGVPLMTCNVMCPSDPSGSVTDTCGCASSGAVPLSSRMPYPNVYCELTGERGSVWLAMMLLLLLPLCSNEYQCVLFIVRQGHFYRILGQNRAMDLDGRQIQFLHDVGVLDLARFLECFPFQPFRGEART